MTREQYRKDRWEVLGESSEPAIKYLLLQLEVPGDIVLFCFFIHDPVKVNSECQPFEEH
jgi:hypothetical protein